MGTMIEAFEKTCCLLIAIIMHHLEPCVPLVSKQKFENFSNKQAVVSSLKPLIYFLNKSDWENYGVDICPGINLFHVQVSDEKRLSRQRLYSLCKVINVLNRYDKNNHEHKRLTLTLEAIIRKANY